MSARMEIEEVSWKKSNPRPSEVEIASLMRNLDARDLIAPLRRNKPAPEAWPASQETDEQKRRTVLKTQARWNACMAERDQLRMEIKRGQECLEQVNAEISGTRAQLEEWARFEQICGRNPLVDYVQSLSAKEGIRQFLPGWLQRRQNLLTKLECEMEAFAAENGLEQGFRAVSR